MFEIDLAIAYGSLTNLFMIGWLLLAIGLFLREDSNWRGRLLLAGGRVIPLFILTVFVVGYLATRHLPGSVAAFEGVLLGFSIPEKVLLAWIEVIGLALLIGRWTIDRSAVPVQ